MKKVLFLSSRSLYPLIGGDKIRVFSSLKFLSSEYKVDLVYIDDKELEKDNRDVLKEYCQNINCFVVSKHRHYWQTLKGLLTNKKPLQVNYYYSKDIQSWIDKNINKYDMVFCNHIRMTEYVRYHKITKIVDFVDSIAMNYEKAYSLAKGLWKLIYFIEKKRVAKYEKNIASDFDKKIIISEVDRKFIDSNNNFNIEVLSNTVSDIVYDKKRKKVQNQICFLGKMDYEPNVSAVVYFVNEIFPVLKENFPSLIFKIIGAYPSNTVLKLNKIEGVEVTGFVENPYNIVCDSVLFVAPMVSGAGIQNKILESMKMGKCVVTTEIGAEGLGYLTGNELIVVKSTTEMIEKINKLLNNRKKCEKIGNLASQYIKQFFSEEIIQSKFLNIVR